MIHVKRGPKRIAIVGAGITGLTAAHRLHKSGHIVRVFEASNRIGGAIKTERSDGWLVEGGPNSLMLSHPIAEALLEELEIASEMIESNPHARKRYIVRNGRPRAVPLSPFALLGSRLFSVGAKCRILLEMLQRPRTRNHDISIDEFVRVHFGREVCKYALNPFVAGTYAGNPGRLSARFAFPHIWDMEKFHGSLLRRQMNAARENGGRPSARLISFKDGLQTLTNTFASKLPPNAIMLNASVEAFLPGARWSVVWRNTVAGGTRNENFDDVLVTVPGPALTHLRLGILGHKPFELLSSIEHPPVSSLFLGFRRDQVAHPLDGFGLLVPEVEKRHLLGALFSSTIFPHRAPEDHVALTVLVGGSRNPEMARYTTEQLLSLIIPDLQELLGVQSGPCFVRHTYWPLAIPQYNLGYDRYFEIIEEVERRNDHIYFGGQVRDGISLPSCMMAGERLARMITERNPGSE